MKQIKYRVWDTDNKEYLKNAKRDWFCLQPNGEVTTGHDDDVDEPAWKDRYIVELFTGLLDKTGKPIYEGDKVKGKHTTTHFYLDGQEDIEQNWEGVVVWRQSACRFVVRETDVRESDMLSCHEYEIIGNIHEGNNV